MKALVKAKRNIGLEIQDGPGPEVGENDGAIAEGASAIEGGCA